MDKVELLIISMISKESALFTLDLIVSNAGKTSIEASEMMVPILD